MRITKQNTSALIIDIQERLFPVMWGKEKLLKNCQIFIRGMAELGIPVNITQQYTKGLGETIEGIKNVLPDFDYIEKREFSCCDEPLVVEKLKQQQAKNVLMCGIESHVCVLQTAIDLKENGFNPVVVMDAVSSRTTESIEIAKERFRYEGIMMTSVESVLFELTRTSAAPEFKAISKLVK
ncbi:MAG: isochorismatase family protein [Mariniphaga sp.]